jgi:tyrosine-protein kinase Etk/Wzc
MIEGDIFQERHRRDKTSFKELLSGLIQKWYYFLITISLCVVAAYFHLRYSVAQYYVSTTILIKEQGNGSGLTANAAMVDVGMLQPEKKLDDEMIVLKSRSLMERVLNELSFNTSYFLEGRVQDMEVYGDMLPLKVVVKKLYTKGFNKKVFIYPNDNNSFQLGETNNDGAISRHTYKFGQQIRRPYAVFTVIETADSLSSSTNEKVIVVFHDVKNLARKYSDNLSVSPVNKTSNVLAIGLTDPVWRRSVDILTKLIEVYKSEAVDDKNAIASNSLSFIDERLRYLNTELTNVEKNVELYKKENDLTDVSSEAALYLKSADDYNKKLAEFDIQLELLKSIEDYLKEKQGSQVELVPS